MNFFLHQLKIQKSDFTRRENSETGAATNTHHRPPRFQRGTALQDEKQNTKLTGKERLKNLRKRANKLKQRKNEEPTQLVNQEIPTQPAPIESCTPPSKSSPATVAEPEQSLLQERQHKKQRNPDLRPLDEMGAPSSDSVAADATLDGPSLVSLPNEMQHEILSYLTYTEVSKLREVRKSFLI